MSACCKPCSKVFHSAEGLQKHKLQCKTHRSKVRQCEFGVDGACTVIGDSRLVSGQKGLFAAEFIHKGTIVTWYCGPIFKTFAAIRRRIASSEQGARYAMDVFAPNDNKQDGKHNDGYYIDGWVNEDEKRTWGKRASATYINHSQTRPNVQFTFLHRRSAFRGCAIAVVALQNITEGSELLVDYGDAYHKQLLKSGDLVH